MLAKAQMLLAQQLTLPPQAAPQAALEVCRNDFQLAYVLMKHACQRKRCLIL
jgi:hypothetical protein